MSAAGASTGGKRCDDSSAPGGNRFTGSVALVTGGGGAIGGATARRLASEGAAVAVNDRDRSAAERVASEIRQAGGRAVAVVADVGDAPGAARAVRETFDALGGLDIVFNNAGVSGPSTLVLDLHEEQWDEVIRINLRGVFLVLRESSRFMVEHKVAGSIVNMASSMSGWDVLEGGAPYAASKSAILGLTRVAALELARHAIRVNAICPGVIETTLGVPGLDAAGTSPALHRFEQRIPLRRIGQPEDVAAAVCFLASKDASYVTGVGWLIDGGQTLQSWSNTPEGDGYPLAGGDTPSSQDSEEEERP